MKEGWEYKKLGEVANVIHGKNQKDVLSEEGKYPIFGSGGTVMGYASDFLCEAGTTILGRKGSINNPKFIEERFWNVDTAFGITPKDDNCSKYIYYFITSIDWLSKNTGTTLPSLTQQVVKDVIIPIPLPSEQQSIVDYLDSAFAKIDAMKANAEKALNEAKALFQASLKEMLEPKEGWEECLLIEEFSLKSGDYLSSKMQKVGDIPVYGGNGITGYHDSYNYDGNQLLIGRVGALCGNIHLTNEKIWVTDNAFVVKNIKSHWNIRFLKYELVFLNLNQYASQSAQPVISNKSMRDVIVQKPSITEQQSIVATLDSLKSKVDRLQENFDRISQECDALKQAILRQVFE